MRDLAAHYREATSKHERNRQREREFLLSVLACGALPITNSWKHEGTIVYVSTNTSYTITNVQTSHATNYIVGVTNQYGGATSLVAGVFVHDNSAARLSLAQGSGTSMWFHVSGVTNRPFRVETTTYLNTNVWYPLFTNWTSFWYTNSPLTNDKLRFYRVITNSWHASKTRNA